MGGKFYLILKTFLHYQNARTMKRIWFTFTVISLFFSYLGPLQSQTDVPATVNIQGVLRQANGIAVDDGTHTIIFKFYDQLTGGNSLWKEIQEIEVTSGIYSTVLGADSLFSDAGITWDRQYYLEVFVSGKALSPRIPLTPAPYALSLLGDPNKFTSSGAIQADGAVFGENLDQAWLDMAETHSLVTKGGVLAREGSPGQNGINNNGFAFSDDKDSGLFSFGTDQVQIAIDSQPKLQIYADSVEILPNLVNRGDIKLTGGDIVLEDTSEIKFENNKGILYNEFKDWRLVEVDYFEDPNNPEGWQVYTSITSSSGVSAPISVEGGFIGNILLRNKTDVFKKAFNTQGEFGPFDYIKVKFNYYLIDDWENGELGYAGISRYESSQPFIGWSTGYLQDFTIGQDWNGSSRKDFWIPGELTSNKYSDAFYIFFGWQNPGSATKNFAVGKIEVWVK
jgi:hypothetical protein